MKKLVLYSVIIFLMSQIVLAANLNVSILEENQTVIVEIDKPATFTLSIKNNEPITDSFEIFSLIGVSIFPKDLFQISASSTKELEIEVFPHPETKRDFRGFYSFEYQIKGQQTGFFKDTLAIKIVELKDAIEVKTENVNLGDQQAILIIKNLENYNFENLTITAESFFFDFQETLDLSLKEQKEFIVPINVDRIKNLKAGEYEVGITFQIDDKKSKQISTVKYLEKGGISVLTDTSGFIIRKKTITKENEGNIDTIATTNIKKDVLSRLFTTYSERPQTSERKGLIVDYSWEKELKPGEKLIITSITNYTFPFVLIIVVIFIILIIRLLIRNDLILQKRVSYVKTKGGEFALKLRLRAKARRPLTNITIIDRLPRLTKLYEGFGSKPDKIDEQARSLIWHLNKLNSGEERVFTYIIYSKVNIIGRLELPAAKATFEKDGKHEHVYSNKAYFAAETSEDVEE